ncbi:solute carrier family 49 member 4 homolog isoform X2 [Mercenaria mercenaria]|nr:solute carrier family 49 member 4 homolog isoform X2 [Mercenaria mercenaria]XP_045209900.2 solute carrier family 49 member 4 homolog isoform X2 [Mercenaria mercenaria]XP_045209901.2 solute carrier family 49 member 4 homolog isoform X2 [Mercenaria mercenaria]
MSSDEDVEERLPIVVAETAVYGRRWYVLVVFCLGSVSQAFVWNTFGPIAESAEIVFNWSDIDIGMFGNYGNIAYMVAVLPMCYFMDVKGLRVSLLMCSFLIMAGTVGRCVSLEPVPASWLANICAVLNGVGGTVPFAGSAAVSSIWFPSDQRATATAIVSFCNYVGFALSFILGPHVVSSPQYSNFNSTSNTTNTFWVSENDNSTHKEVTNRSTLEIDIRHYLYIQASVGVLFFVLVLIYFPDKPPKPPSSSASLKRTDYLKGLSQLVCNGSVWLIVLACAVPTGVLQVWQSLLVVNLKPLSISQNTAGYMGFWQTLSGCFAGLVIARFSDMFMKRMKLFLISLFIGAVASSAWFFVLWKQYIPLNLISMYTACILIGIFINGGIPLFFEIACEASYPVAEGVTGGLLTLLNNIVGICFLCVLLIPNIGRTWMNEALLGSTVVALPLLIIYPERYRRTDLDITIDVSPSKGDLQTSEKDVDIIQDNS